MWWIIYKEKNILFITKRKLRVKNTKIMLGLPRGIKNHFYRYCAGLLNVVTHYPLKHISCEVLRLARCCFQLNLLRILQGIWGYILYDHSAPLPWLFPVFLCIEKKTRRSMFNTDIFLINILLNNYLRSSFPTYMYVIYNSHFL